MIIIFGVEPVLFLVSQCTKCILLTSGIMLFLVLFQYELIGRRTLVFWSLWLDSFSCSSFVLLLEYDEWVSRNSIVEKSVLVVGGGWLMKMTGLCGKRSVNSFEEVLSL